MIRLTLARWLIESVLRAARRQLRGQAWTRAEWAVVESLRRGLEAIDRARWEGAGR